MDDPIIIGLEGPDGEIRLSPPIFIDNTINVSPADMSQFTPQGNGVYGLQHSDINPFTMGESMEPTSGVVFFGRPNSKEDFMGMLRLLGISSSIPGGDERTARKYWAFKKTSEQPGQDGYLTQLRVVDRFGLKFLFGAIDEAGYDGFPEQPLTLPEFLWAFIVDQIKQYSGDGYEALKGTFGGDGDFAIESLSFGLMIENSYHNVYRIWSRAWLCTK